MNNSNLGSSRRIATAPVITPRLPRTHAASPPRSYSFVAAVTQLSLAGPNGPHVYVRDSAQQYYDVRARVLHPRLILAAV